MQSRRQPLPVSDTDWTTHALNIHGTFFQRWCERVVDTAKPWVAKAVEYPVAYPPLQHVLKSNESALDIMAEVQFSDFVLTLLIECKKDNPDLSHWIFFPASSSSTGSATMNCRQIDIVGGTGDYPKSWSMNSGFRQFAPVRGPVCPDAREVKGTYQGLKNGHITKTSNADIRDAAWQIALATQSVVTEEERRNSALIAYAPAPYHRHVIVPVIVTTAHLFVCEFDAAKVDASTGELDWADAQYAPCQQVIFEYALPPQLFPMSLLNMTSMSVDAVNSLGRMQILVMTSTALPGMLEQLAAVVSVPSAM